VLIPPSVIYIRVRRRRGRGLWLLLPVFLAWPLLAALEALAVPVVMAAAPAALPWGYSRTVLGFVPRMMELFASLRGLRVATSSSEAEIRIVIL